MNIKKRKAMIAINGFGVALATPEEAILKMKRVAESLHESKTGSCTCNLDSSSKCNFCLNFTLNRR